MNTSVEKLGIQTVLMILSYFITKGIKSSFGSNKHVKSFLPIIPIVISVLLSIPISFAFGEGLSNSIEIAFTSGIVCSISYQQIRRNEKGLMK